MGRSDAVAPHVILFSTGSMLVFVTGSSLFLSHHALYLLRLEKFSRIKYFWLLFTPVLNVAVILFLACYTSCLWISAYIDRHIEYYEKATEKEFENILQSVLTHTKSMNEKIKHMKDSCNTRTDAIIVEIMEASQDTIRIVKG